LAFDKFQHGISACWHKEVHLQAQTLFPSDGEIIYDTTSTIHRHMFNIYKLCVANWQLFILSYVPYRQNCNVNVQIVKTTA